MKNKTKNTIILLSIITFLLIGIITYFKISFNRDIKIITESKKNNFLISEKINDAVGIKNKIKEIETVGKSFDDFFIDKNKVLGFIENIENIATANNVILIIDNVNSDETHLKENLPYGLLKMTLIAKGDFSSVNKFLSDIEKIPYYIDFSGMKMISITDQSVSNWSINISLTALTK
jgi:hypothetical protein